MSMDPGIAAGMAAAFSFLCNIFELLAFSLLVIGFFNLESTHFFPRTVVGIAKPIIGPFEWLTAKLGLGTKAGPILFLALIIPLQMIVLHELRQISG